MRVFTAMVLSAAILSIPGAAFAAKRTVTLDVQNMTCPLCPFTVDKALQKVTGVTQSSVDFFGKTATVEFNDAVSSTDALTRATGAAGYPSTVRQ